MSEKKNENINEKNTPRIVNNHIKFFFYSLSSIVFFSHYCADSIRVYHLENWYLAAELVVCVCAWAWAWAWKTPCNERVQWCTCTYLHVHVNDLMHGSRSVCIVQACDWPYSYSRLCVVCIRTVGKRVRVSLFWKCVLCHDFEWLSFWYFLSSLYTQARIIIIWS